MNQEINNQKAKKWIIALSIILPLAVAALFGIKIDGVDLSFLPPIYATTNGLTGILLIVAFIAIKNGNKELHKKLIYFCLALSSMFLLMYVAYHMTSEPTEYGGDLKTVYYFILISHIILSIAVVPLVLFTFLRAYTNDFKRHKKLARFTFPLWLYVAFSGVIVYLMISPFY